MFNGVGLTEDEKDVSIKIEELPPKEDNGKQAILKCNQVLGAVWWEYIDTPDSREKELQIEVDELKLMVAELGLITGGGL